MRAGSRVCVEALSVLIIWSEFQCGSYWWSGQSADSFCREVDPKKLAQSVSAVSVKIGWKHSSFVVSLIQLSLGVTAVSV